VLRFRHLRDRYFNIHAPQQQQPKPTQATIATHHLASMVHRRMNLSPCELLKMMKPSWLEESLCNLRFDARRRQKMGLANNVSDELLLRARTTLLDYHSHHQSARIHSVDRARLRALLQRY
jgi:hypothetical protein